MQNLTETELRQINGGGTLGVNQAQAGISLTSQTDGLLSITFTRSYGSHTSTTSLSAGNNIRLALLGFGSNTP